MYENPTRAFTFSEGSLAMGGLSPFYSVRPKAFFGKKEMTLWGLLQGDSRDVKFVVDDKVEPGLNRGPEKKVIEGSVQAGDSATEEKGEEASSGEKKGPIGSLQVRSSSDDNNNEDLASRLTRKRKAAPPSSPKPVPAPRDIRLRLRSASGQKAFLATRAASELPPTGIKGSLTKHLRSSSLVSEPLLGSSHAPIEIPTAPFSSRVRDKTPEVIAARIVPVFEILLIMLLVPANLLILRVLPPDPPWLLCLLTPFWLHTSPSGRSLSLPWGVGMLQRVDDLRRENEGLKNDLKTSQVVAAELRCQVVDAEHKLQEDKGAGVMLEQKERAWAREMADLVEEKEEVAAELKHQKELDSVSQEQLDTMYAEWGITSDNNQKLAKEKYWLITEGFGSFLPAVSQSKEFKSNLKDEYAYSAQGLGRKETPLYNSKAKKRLFKLGKEFGGKTPALLEKILELPLMSIDELKALLTPAGPSSLKSLSGDDS
ncbi:hypothetical protein Hanom_Chr09g00805701 [Helianthus anomalus]